MDPVRGMTRALRTGPFPVGDGTSSVLVMQAPSMEPEERRGRQQVGLYRERSALTDGLADTMTVQESAQLLRVPTIVALADERVDAKALHEVQVHFLAPREQLRANVKVGVHNASSVKHVRADVQRRRVAVIDPEAFESSRERADIGRHVLPEPRVGRRSIAVAKLDAVAPDNDLAPKVSLGRQQREVLQRIRVPDPAVVGDRILERILIGVGRDAGEVDFDQG